ncbi:MAG: hypothetical protein IKD73_02875 [Selenomonadaceae bacterium]|nr:hypothetical protein [Selenomonadaceae bacterium]
MRKVFMATLMVVMMIAATALAANWQQIYTDNDDNVIYFDTDSVSANWQGAMQDTGDVTFSAMFRMNYSDKGRNDLIDWYRNYSIVPAGIENLSYDISTIQFKKEGDKRYYHISERVSYTASGSQITGMHYVNSEPNWQEIPVASVVDVEYNEAKLIVDGKLYKRVDSADL